MVIPVGPRYQQDLLVVERRADEAWEQWSDGPVVFVPLVGEGGWDERAEPTGDRGGHDGGRHDGGRHDGGGCQGSWRNDGGPGGDREGWL